MCLKKKAVDAGLTVSTTRTVIDMDNKLIVYLLTPLICGINTAGGVRLLRDNDGNIWCGPIPVAPLHFLLNSNRLASLVNHTFDKKLETNPSSRFTAVFLAHFSVSLLCHLFSDRNPGPAVMSLAFIFDRRGGRKKN